MARFILYTLCVLTILGCAPKVERENTAPGKTGEISSPQRSQENETSPKVVKGVYPTASNEKPSKNATGGIPYTEPLYGEILKVAKIALSKGSPALVRRDGTLFEAIPLKVKKECGTVLVKVKERKNEGEKDYVVSLCGDSVEIKSR